MNVEQEVHELVHAIKRLGAPTPGGEGLYSVKFGVLFADDACAQLFEALLGTLRAAKKRKVVNFPGQILMQGVHDDVDVVLLVDEYEVPA